MKFIIPVEVEIDRKVYDAAYGTGESVHEIREWAEGTVRDAVENALSVVDARVGIRKGRS